jgi:hypothetical protein
MRYLESEQSTITVTEQPGALSRTQLDVDPNAFAARGQQHRPWQHQRGPSNLGTVEQPGLTGRIDIEEG